MLTGYKLLDKSAQSGNAFTDLFTNYMQLGPLTADADPRPWLGHATAPFAQLGPFLHEITHHWCFLTPVNTAIAQLTARARMNLVQLSDDAAVSDSPFVDAAATSAAIHLLKPIHEGLALFAEFDASTRLDSKIEVSPS